MPGLTVTSSVAGDAEDTDIQAIAFIPLGGGEWKATVTGTVLVDGNLMSVTREFAAVPAGVVTWLNATGLPLAKSGLKASL
jgi:hypothetical protein